MAEARADLVIRGGTVVTAVDSFVADVAIRAGRISAIGADLPTAEQEIDATGLQVLPGGVDVHTHLDAPVGDVTAVDDFESGTAAAACGGVTTICDYAWQQPGQTIAEGIETWKRKALGKAYIDYGFHVILSDASDERLAELADSVAAGYPSFKVFMIKEFGIGDEGIVRVMAAARAAGAVVNVHAENGAMLEHCAADLRARGRSDPRFFAESRPPLAEAEATRRALDYAALTGAEVYIVHLSCADALAAVRAARAAGVRCWAETRPIYLALSDELYARGGVEAAKLAGAPPLRSRADQAALWAGLATGEIQAIGSDNTSWTVEQKAVGKDDFTRVPYGVPGLQTEMQVVYSEGVSRGRISVNTFVASFCTNPARIFGLYPRKGTIAVGSDADLVLFDPGTSMTIGDRPLLSRAGYDPFEGLHVTGTPVMTFSRGELIARDGVLLARPGRGQHLLRYRTPRPALHAREEHV